MRRLIAIVLLMLLPFQAVWAAVEPYCQHESSLHDAAHWGHHEFQHHDAAEAVQLGDGVQDSGNDSVSLDHEHHCCSAMSLLPTAVKLPGQLPAVALVPTPLAGYSSFDATLIERPNWGVSS